MSKSKDELEKEIQELRNELEEVKQKNSNNDEVEKIRKTTEDSGLSRRGFLKALGGGAAGLGAAAMLPSVAGFEIKDSNSLKYFNQSSSKSSFEVDPSGNLDVTQIGTSSNPIPQTYTNQLGSDSSKVENINSKTLNTERIGNTAEHIVSSKSELQSAFNNLSAGDTIWIETPETPYRTDQWLDIDVSEITVKAQNPRAKNGERLIKAADGANVGGIRVGYNAAVSDVQVIGVGFDGNKDNQAQDIHHKDGIVVADATNIVIDGCDVAWLSPYHKHGTGGDGISVLHDANRVWVTNNRIDNAGDRSIEVAGTNIVVAQNHVTNGYDRGTSFQVQADPRDGSDYVASNVVISGNIYDGISDGSAVGMNSGVNGVSRNVTIAHNFARDTGRLPTIRDEVIGLSIVGNTAYNIDGMNITGTAKDVAVCGNTIVDSDTFGINAGNAERVQISGNVVKNPSGHGITVSGIKVSVTNNMIYGASQQGVNVTSGQNSVRGNTVARSGGENIAIVSGQDNLISSNIVKHADQNGNGATEFLIQGSDHIVMGNQCVKRSNDVFTEANSAARILYIGNRGPDAIVNMWNPSEMDDHSWGFGNFPALFDDEGTVNLSTGSSPAARVESVSSSENVSFDVEVQPDPNATHPDSNYSWEHYMEWDASNSQWDLVIEWRTDPGSDVSAVYEVTRNPTSRAIKDA
jgi:hypothetical protein